VFAPLFLSGRRRESYRPEIEKSRVQNVPGRKKQASFRRGSPLLFSPHHGRESDFIYLEPSGAGSCSHLVGRGVRASGCVRRWGGVGGSRRVGRTGGGGILHSVSHIRSRLRRRIGRPRRRRLAGGVASVASEQRADQDRKNNLQARNRPHNFLSISFASGPRCLRANLENAATDRVAASPTSDRLHQTMGKEVCDGIRTPRGTERRFRIRSGRDSGSHRRYCRSDPRRSLYT
jgi:hypothetical protein